MNKSDGGVPHLMSAYDHVEPTMSEQALPTIEEIFNDYCVAVYNGLEPLGLKTAKAQLQRLMAQERLDEATKAGDIWVNKNEEQVGKYFDKRFSELESQVKGSKENTNG